MMKEIILETERFLKSIKSFSPHEEYDFSASKSRSAVKRASMDLSRKLTELRQAQARDWK